MVYGLVHRHITPHLRAMLQFRVPASTTNLGHGFDCLGMALGATNTVSVQPSGDSLITAPEAPDDGLGRMASAIRDACSQLWGIHIPGFSVRVTGNVPLSRGMGSSSTVILGVTAACQRLVDRALDKDDIINISAVIEGHPDNVTASCLGGFTIAAQVGKRLRYHKINVPETLVAVVAIPPYEVKTTDARRILPPHFQKEEGIRAIQRTALITAILSSGDIEKLHGLFDDAWHENYRAALNPGLVEARQAAEKAGAIGTILSGSGSTVLSFSHRDHADVVKNALLGSYNTKKINADVRILPFDNEGLVAL